MSILRIAIFQKDLGNKLDIATLKKVSSTKANILILPEYFYARKDTQSYQDLCEQSRAAEEWLFRLSEAFKGIIVGGGIFHKTGKQIKIGIPVLKNSMIIDWSYKENLERGEKSIASPVKSEGIFILDGIQFAVSFYSDIHNKEKLSELKEQGIQLILILGNFTQKDKKENILKKLQGIASKYSFNIVLTSAVGNIQYSFSPLLGYSFALTPYGTSWKASETDKNNELLKIIMLSHRIA